MYVVVVVKSQSAVPGSGLSVLGATRDTLEHFPDAQGGRTLRDHIFIDLGNISDGFGIDSVRRLITF